MESKKKFQKKVTKKSSNKINGVIELEEKASIVKVKHTVFYNNVENEMESLKQDLQVEDDKDIHFIKGNFKDFYEEMEILVEGTTATVKKCMKKGTDKKYAVKIIHYRGDTEMLVLVRIVSLYHHKQDICIDR